MKLRYKILSGVGITFTVAITALALMMSNTDDCGPAPTVSSDSELMKAIVYRCYGYNVISKYNMYIHANN